MQKRAGGVEFLIPGGRVNRAGRRFIQIGTRHFVSRSPRLIWISANLSFGWKRNEATPWQIIHASTCMIAFPVISRTV